MEKKIEIVPIIKIPEYTGLKQGNLTLNVPPNWDGHAYGRFVGRVFEDGTVESAFIEDQNNDNTKIFDRLRSDCDLLVTKGTVINRKNELFNVKQFYIPYKVKGHLSDNPTVTDNYIDCCMNVKYHCKYEILLVAEEGFKKYIYEEYDTSGSNSLPFYECVDDLRNTFEEYFENGEHGFMGWEDNELSVYFYNDCGERILIDVLNINELVSMVASIRVVELTKEIIE